VKGSRPFHFVAPVYFEQWDYRNPDDPGIGGSETQVVEMARRLAARGEEVRVFAPLRKDTESLYEGVHWHPLEEIERYRQENAVWVLSRCPKLVDLGFGGETWLVCQDEDYMFQDRDVWSPERVERIDRVLALCPTHQAALLKHEELAGKVWLSTNGVRVDLLEQMEQEGIERDPNKCMYFSSPDRGLVQAVLPNWGRVREFAPEAELHIYYGWDNIQKWIAKGVKNDAMRSLLARFERLKDREGVVWHGRMGQTALYRELLSASVWPYWSDFKETSCIASQEAQAAGLIPVVRPIWAVGDNVRFGLIYDGSAYSDGLALASAVGYTASAVSDPAFQETLRPRMMQRSRFRFDWERVVDQYQCWERGMWFPHIDCAEDHGLPLPWTAFQRLESEGTTLIVGAGGDVANFWNLPGCVLTDVAPTDPVTGRLNRIHFEMQGDDLQFPDNSFDSVVLGEVIEHVDLQRGLKMVDEALRVSRSRVVVTVPEDGRSIEQQMSDDLRDIGQVHRAEQYHGGASTYHVTRWTEPLLRKMAETLGARVVTHRRLRQPYGAGHGIVLSKGGV
jgi:glycosyltransferase involved in cell wall biosynthesis